MGKAFLKHIIKSNRQLLTAIVAFNASTACTLRSNKGLDTNLLTPQGKAFLDAGLFEKAMESERGKKRLCSLLPLLVEDAPESWFLDFMVPRSRLALLDAHTLRKLAEYLGLAVNAGEVSRCIMKAQVNSIKETFEEDGYMFAVKRASFLTGDCSGLIPAVEGADLNERILRQGYAGIALCFAQEDKTLLKRLQIILPRDFFSTPPQGTKVDIDALWKVIRRILLKEVAPQWAPCFA